VETLFEDRDGSLWVGTSGAGVGRYRSGSFVPFTTHEGLADNTTETIFEDSRGALWIGTANGLSRRTNQSFHTFSATDLGDGVVQSIAEDALGRVWVATSKGVAIFDGHLWKRMGPRENIPVDIHVLYKDRRNRMWMGSPEGITIWDRGRPSRITQKDGLPGNYVMSILEDRLNVMWIGTITGLARLENGKITTYTTRDGLLSNYIQCLSEDSDGILWICTPSGLHRFKNGQFHGFTVKEGMFADSTLRLLEDGHRRFWISSYRGIFSVNRDDLNRLADGSLKHFESASYGTDDGLKSTSCGGLGMQPAGWKARDGRLWFPTDKGVVRIDPSNLSAPAEAPTPVLEATQKDGVLTSDTNMQPETRRIAFLFTAPTSVKPEAIEYRYRMQGYEDKWHEIGTDRQVSFTNLPAGTYRFFVSARRAGGNWSADEATLPIHMLPHFYETRWFYLASGFLLLLLIGLAHSLRVRETERRLTTIMAERSRVAQELHDTLLQSVAGTAMEIQGALRLLRHGSTETGFRQLSTALDHLGKSMADARQAIWDLRAPESCDLPVDQALESAARRVCERGPRLSWIVLGTPVALAQSFKRQVYGIGIEAVTNAARHSGCSEISITFEYRQDSIELLVRDDGCGFDCALAESAYLSNHWGLAGMKERAKQCFGKIAIESTPGTGTVVRFEAPLGMEI
jgi:signal transduction histidine kinase/streptogramin lyase